jgi:DNA-binding transcriptional LysR family regulator
MAITVTQLSAFLAVIRGGSVTAAADSLLVTQPSVSAAVAALARELGCELFEREGRGIRPTEAGAAFAPYAADVLGLLAQGRQASQEAAATVGRRLRIAAVTTAAESFVPLMLRAFASEHPDVELVLDVGNRGEVLDRIRDHSADVAVTGRPPEEKGFEATVLMDNEIVCITAADDALAGTRVRASELRERTWLLREPGSGTRSLNELFLVERGISPVTLTLGSNGAIKQAARAGLGVSLMSRAAVDVELASGLLAEIVLDDGPPVRPWFVLRSSVGPLRPSVAAFLAFVRATGPLLAAGAGPYAQPALAGPAVSPASGSGRGPRASPARPGRRPPGR